MNPRISAKERNLLKGAIRRVFSRSDLRRAVVDATIVHGHADPERPRVKKWSRCMACQGFVPTYLIEVDHIDPIIPTDKTLDDLAWDTVIDRVWCEKNNLQGLCDPCHNDKTKVERKAREQAKKGRKINGR